jgi:hypothetical protein
VQSIVAIEKNTLMHNVVLLATFNLLLHRRNKKKRQDIENNVLNAIQEPLIRNMFNGDLNEQDTEKAEFIK